MIRILPVALVLAACGGPSSDPVPAAAAATSPAPAPAACESDLPDPIATVGGTAITLAELESKAAAGVIAAKQKAHEAREQALEGLVLDMLIEGEAKARGVEPEALLAAEVDAKITPPTEEAIKAFYDENQARMPAPFDAMKDRIAEHLGQMGKGERMRAFIDELEAKTPVVKNLPVFRVAVDARATAARKGPEGAPVHIVEFSDFQCPYCTRAAATVEQVIEKYGDKVSFEYRHFPLGFHDKAHLAAEASECANEQQGFWKYHDLLFANQTSLDRSSLLKYATDAGLDAEKFTACLDDGRHAKTVDDDMAAGERVGMSGTPGFYVNGRMIAGAQPLEAFVEIIDAELAER